MPLREQQKNKRAESEEVVIGYGLFGLFELRVWIWIVSVQEKTWMDNRKDGKECIQILFAPLHSPNKHSTFPNFW